MQRNRAAFAAICLTFCLGSASAALAGQTGTIRLQSDITGDDAYAALGTGEYGVSSFTGFTPPPLGTDVAIGSYVFQTFSVEQGDALALNTTYNWELNTSAVSSGLLGLGTITDPLDERTAYLFTQFWNGTLSGYDYDDLGTGLHERALSAAQLQNAIWALEGELSLALLSVQSLAWIAEADHAVDSGAWSGLGTVGVLNLTTASGARRRDMLVLTGPNDPIPVPLPPAAAAGLVLLGGLGAMRRRRANAR